MTENSDPFENAVAERINRTIKDDFTHERQMSFCNLQKAKTNIKTIIDFYNNQRPHSSVEMLTPSQAYKGYGELRRMWKNYRKEKYIKEKMNVDLHDEGDFIRHKSSKVYGN